MAIATVYDGRISGATISADLITAAVTSGANLLVIPYSNGQRVVIVNTQP